MLRCRRVLILFIIFIITVAYGEALVTKPEWLQGKIAIDLYGDDRLLGAWPYERYICVFNLDNNRIDSIKIPDDSIVLKEWEAGGRVAFAYPRTTGFNYTDNYSDNRWRDFEYIQLIPVETEEGTIYKRGESKFDWLNDSAADERVFYDSLWMDSPLRILGLSGDDTPIHDGGIREGLYLVYGLSWEGKIELQLQKYEKNGHSVLYHFPVDYDFGAWQYAISPTGKIAWWSEPGELLCATSDGILKICEEMQLNNALTWKNDTELLFFGRTEMNDEFILKKWNLSTGVCEDYFDLTGGKIFTEVYPWSIAVNGDGCILAIYGSTGEQNVIQFINLQTTESYIIFPWTEEVEDSRYDFNWYGVSDQGVMYYSSNSLLQSQLLWVPD